MFQNPQFSSLSSKFLLTVGLFKACPVGLTDSYLSISHQESVSSQLVIRNQSVVNQSVGISQADWAGLEKAPRWAQIQSKSFKARTRLDCIDNTFEHRIIKLHPYSECRTAQPTRTQVFTKMRTSFFSKTKPTSQQLSITNTVCLAPQQSTHTHTPPHTIQQKTCKQATDCFFFKLTTLHALV